jgi:hypothetical protein
MSKAMGAQTIVLLLQERVYTIAHAYLPTHMYTDTYTHARHIRANKNKTYMIRMLTPSHIYRQDSCRLQQGRQALF